MLHSSCLKQWNMDLILTVSASICVCNKDRRGGRTPRAAVSHDVMRCDKRSIDPSFCWNMPGSLSVLLCESRTGSQQVWAANEEDPLQQQQLYSRSLEVLQKDSNIRLTTCFGIRLTISRYQTMKSYFKWRKRVLFGEIYQYFVNIWLWLFHELMFDLSPEILRSENTSASFQGLFFMNGITFFSTNPKGNFWCSV